MTDGLEEFRKLADEAAAETYDPRAGRCLPFFHRWSMWDRDGFYQFRRCMRCGKWQIGTLTWGQCRHHWANIHESPLFGDMNGKTTVGHIYRQSCDHCGDIRSVTVHN